MQLPRNWLVRGENGAVDLRVSVLRADGKSCRMPLALLEPRQSGGTKGYDACEGNMRNVRREHVEVADNMLKHTRTLV